MAVFNCLFIVVSTFYNVFRALDIARKLTEQTTRESRGYDGNSVDRTGDGSMLWPPAAPSWPRGE